MFTRKIMSKIQFTFIIPNYNTPIDILTRCVRSIPVRDDVQILIIDDHTPFFYDDHGQLRDSLIKTLPEYARNNVQYDFLEKNSGPGVARNVGLKKAKGEWVLFIDSDDYYDTLILENLLSYSQNTSSELILFGYKFLKYEEKIERFAFENELGEDFHRIHGKDLERFVTVMYPWARMLKRSLIERVGAKFEKLYLSEDRLFCVNTFFAARNKVFYTKPVYNYSYVPTSLSQNIVGLSKLKGAVDVAIKVNRIYKNNGLLGKVYDDTICRFMIELYKHSTFWYWFFIVKLFIFVDYKTVQKVRTNVCWERRVHLSLFRQLREKILS